jgi:hypothetical protein
VTSVAKALHLGCVGRTVCPVQIGSGRSCYTALQMRRVVTALIILFVTAELVLCAGFYWAMRQSPDTFGRIASRTPMPLMMALPFETLWTRARRGAVNPGEPAPDFRLPTLDHKSAVQLSSFRGDRPVVLVFGSYT